MQTQFFFEVPVGALWMQRAPEALDAPLGRCQISSDSRGRLHARVRAGFGRAAVVSDGPRWHSRRFGRAALGSMRIIGYRTDLRGEMVAKGWLAEGDGPDLVVMCAP
jgi:hypothetical protein